MKKISVVTSTRADYGILKPLISKLDSSDKYQLQLIVTGSHLSKKRGYTIDAIRQDGIPIGSEIDILTDSSSEVDITRSMGLAISKFGEVIDQLDPELFFVLGDRFEIMCAAQAAMILGKPIAHIAGGDVTEGAYDDAIRHSITKMSHLHFTTNKESADRVRQLGENPEHIYNVGSLGIEMIMNTEIMDKAELEENLNFKFNNKNFLITYHPETVGGENNNFSEFLQALEHFDNDTNFIFTYPNIDKGGDEIIKQIDQFVEKVPNAFAFQSLGQLRYYSMISYCDVVVGNSSSGLYEVPTFKKPTVNIGDRQKGRPQASSVVQTDTDKQSIIDGISKSLSLDCNDTQNPYGDGKTVHLIMNALNNFNNFKELTKKSFFKL